MYPAARDYGCWQAILSRESGRISRKNCAVQRSKGPPIGLVDMFQTSPKAPVCRDRRPRAASLAPSCQFPFCPHRPAGPMALTVYRSRGRGWAPAPTSLYFLPSRIATHQGGPACPFKAIYLLSASAPWAGTSPAPTPRLQGAPAQKDTPQAMPAACPPVFPSVCDRSPGPARPSLSAPAPHRHRHGCCMPWRSLDPA